MKVRDLAAAILGLVGRIDPAEGPSRGLTVDGVWHHPEEDLVDLVLLHGSRVEPMAHPPTPVPPAPPSARALVLTGGLRAGARHRVPPGRAVVIGRGDDCDVVVDDPSVSRRHAVLVDDRGVLRVTDLGSRNGTAVAGRTAVGPTRVGEHDTMRLGATRAAWRSEPDDVPHGVRARLGAALGTVPFNRPPRFAPAHEARPVVVPAEPPEPGSPEPLSWAGIILPLIIGAVVALLLSPLMAVFAAFGPLVTVGTWFERRRRATRSNRHARRILRHDLARLQRSLPRALAEERARLLAAHPDPAEVTRRAAGPSVRCWERRPGDPDHLVVAVGTGARPWDPPLTVEGRAPLGGDPRARAGAAGRPARPAEDAIALIGGLPAMLDVPIPVSLGADRVVGIVGPVEVSRSIARSLIVQVAVHHGPADVSIAVVGARDAEPGGQPGRAAASRAADPWRWARWLPHTADPGSGRVEGMGALVSDGSHEANEAVVRASGADGSDRLRLVVVEGRAALTGRGAAGTKLLPPARRGSRSDADSGRPPSSGLVLVADAHELPEGCRTVIRVDHPAGRVRIIDPRCAGASDDIVAWGMSDEVAAEAARGLARLDDPELDEGVASVPDRLSLLELLPMALDPAAIARSWAGGGACPSLSAPIGVDARGPMEIDLVTDGPHLL
ncbi:MAG: FHA domain-containing protein, partial [Acidimicrobiales bacterium]